MVAMQYPPHITLAIYDEISADDLIAGLSATVAYLSKMTIRFESLGYFEAPYGIVLWAAPLVPQQVIDAHESLHSKLGVKTCRDNYRPGNWVPHCSLAADIDFSRKDDAIGIVEQGIEPFEVTFDTADCASFMPVKVLKEVKLEP
jgi:2'-5' RNA ligase